MNAAGIHLGAARTRALRFQGSPDGSAQYAVASGLGEGAREITLHQRSEAFFGPSLLLGFTTQPNQTLVPASYCAARRLELIGDSITCGYGVEGANQYCGFSKATENHALIYAAIAARTPEVEAHTVAWSGKGMLCNNDGSANETMPVLWLRAIATESTSRWDLSRWMPDAVVIDLTNDFAQGIPAKADFNSAYVRFLDDVRARYPSAQIQLAIGPMLSGSSLSAIREDLHELLAGRRGRGDTNSPSWSSPCKMCLPAAAGATGTRARRRTSEWPTSWCRPFGAA